METIIDIQHVRDFVSVDYGFGDGSGFGDGDGYGILNFCGHTVNKIDGIYTILTQIKNNVAKGYILNLDLTTEKCYVVKDQNLFAHGKTVKEAYNSLQKKILSSLSVEERIVKFKDNFKSITKKYKAKNLFDYHGILTNSCEQGRLNFCKNHNINLDKDTFTITEFIKITEKEYCGEIIKQLKQAL